MGPQNPLGPIQLSFSAVSPARTPSSFVSHRHRHRHAAAGCRRRFPHSRVHRRQPPHPPRRIRHPPRLAALLLRPPPPSTSSRLRKALVLRALHAEGASSSSSTLLLRKARKVLADPDAASCFSHQLSLADNEEDDEARAAAAVADLKRLLDHEWANLPTSTLELAAYRLAGDGALQTWVAADHTERTKLRLLVGVSSERKILAKLGQDASASHPPVPPEVADNTCDVNQTDGARLHRGPDPSKKNDEADRAQQRRARHQDGSTKGAPGVQLPEKSVATGIVTGKVHDTPQVKNKATTSHIIGQSALDSTKSHPVAASKRSLMERNPNASTYEWDGLGDSDDDRPVGKCELPPFEGKPKPSPAFTHKTRKKWSEIEQKTLLEGLEKYGKGNWKDIKVAYPAVFEDGSTVDLKDKFRNMERHQQSD